VKPGDVTLIDRCGPVPGESPQPSCLPLEFIYCRSKPVGDKFGLECKNWLTCVASQSNRYVTFLGNRQECQPRPGQSRRYLPSSHPTTNRGHS